MIVNAEWARRRAESHLVQVGKQGMHGGSPRTGWTANGVSDANDTITYVAARQRLFISEAAARAAASGAQWIDTAAPNYATGRAHDLLAPALAAHPSLRIATKTGYFTAVTGADAVNDGVLTEDQAVAGHSLAPDYVRWQIHRNREQLGRERLDLVLLHNPERAHPGDRHALHRAIRDAFVVLEEAVAAGHVAGYGIARGRAWKRKRSRWRACSPWPVKSPGDSSTTTWSRSRCRSAW
ncbi:aldo/keto reductase [Streptomyces sp. NPDC057474]|uniref:aldo/keto reductase n=1 Tax=Streptomyces sp. NPDC057474 TaxID=3346144 RepID=UPI0036A276F6